MRAISRDGRHRGNWSALFRSRSLPFGKCKMRTVFNVPTEEWFFFRLLPMFCVGNDTQDGFAPESDELATDSDIREISDGASPTAIARFPVLLTLIYLFICIL